MPGRSDAVRPLLSGQSIRASFRHLPVYRHVCRYVCGHACRHVRRHVERSLAGCVADLADGQPDARAGREMGVVQVPVIESSLSFIIQVPAIYRRYHL